MERKQYTNAPLSLSSRRHLEERENTNKMPKDPKRNRSYYDIGGGDINQFEFQHNQTAMAEEERARFEQSEAERQGVEALESAPQSEAERIAQMMEDAREKVARKKAKQAHKDGDYQAPSSGAKKASGGTKKAASAKASQKKSTAAKKSGAAKKGAGAAKKKAAKKSATAKSATAKSGAKKASGKKSSAAGKSSASKSGAKKSGAKAAKGAAGKTARKR